MRLWLAQRFGRAGGNKSSSATTGHASGRAMSIESLEHRLRNRFKKFLRHTWLIAILGTIVLAAVLSYSIYYFEKATVIRVAAGPDGSVNAKFVELLSQKLAQDHSKIRLQLVPTQGAEATGQAMANGQADLAILPGGSASADSANWPVVAILRQNVMVFIVPPASTPATATASATPATTPTAKSKSGTSTKNAKSTKSTKSTKTAKSAKTAKATKTAKSDSDDNDDDTADDSNALKVPQLSGKRIGIVTGNEATADLLDLVLEHYGVSPGTVQVSMIDPKNLVEAIHGNQVDVVFVAGSATGNAVTGAVATATLNGKAPTFIEIDQADGIAKRNPAFDSVDIDAGTFGGNPPSPDDSLKSLSFAEYLVVNKAFDHTDIGTLTKDLYVDRQSLDAAMLGDIKIEAPSTDKDGAVTIAPGALAYLTDNQQDFFDKYGNEIFYGMLIFPVFGSAIAGMASYLRSDSRTRRLRLLQRVLDLVRKVHSAQTLETIEQIQIEADNMVIAIIHHSEHEEFDDTVRMSFSFALDQLRFAIAARRTAILDHIGAGTKAAAA
jgi:TRAP-type uncharacterized transport system substrate-binding protein